MGKVIDKINKIKSSKESIKEAITLKGGVIATNRFRDFSSALDKIPYVAGDVKLIRIRENQLISSTTTVSKPKGEWAVMLMGHGGRGGSSASGYSYNGGGSGGGAGFITFLYFNEAINITEVSITDSKTSCRINGEYFEALKGGDGEDGRGSGGGIPSTIRGGGSGSAKGGDGGGGSWGRDFGHTNALGRNPKGGKYGRDYDGEFETGNGGSGGDGGYFDNGNPGGDGSEGGPVFGGRGSNSGYGGGGGGYKGYGTGGDGSGIGEFGKPGCIVIFNVLEKEIIKK